ncbi:MAG: cyanophycin synthetase [Firmicutes bacterium HGW-Firmicutes-14]|nr:MAG: cyanophycin synthetase [Firmicutes bacterium HGW-Firmicutes-14]
MKIIEIRPIEGANIYCHRPVIQLTLDLEEYADTSTDKVPGFAELLLSHIPSLGEHYCSRGRPGGFAERLREGTYIGHVIEHTAIELQHLAGMDVVYGKTIRTGAPGINRIITEYESKEAGIAALKTAVEFVWRLLDGKPVDIGTEPARIREVAGRYGLGPSTEAIAREAGRRGIPVMRLGEGSILQLGYGKHQQKVQATITGRTNCIGIDIACDKALVKELLAESGIPVPWGGIARTEKEAVEIAEHIGEKVVVKPYDGNQGKGVALNLRTKKEISRAFEVAVSISPKVIVEKFIVGKHYRLVVVDDRVVAASERIPAFVIGDGHNTIEELVEMVNRDPLRGEAHEKPLTKIKIDPIVLMVLAKKGLTPQSVPAQSEIVYLRENANISTGGVAVDVTGQVHRDTIELVIRAVRLVGLDVAGVDLVARDIGRPLVPGNGAIIEINAAPGIRMHHYPARGKARNVAGAIVDMLFPPGAKARIPIVSITGTNGKTTVTRMVSHILQAAGLAVGSTTSDGIYIGGRKIVDGDTTGPQSARVVLREPSVEIAVLETARGGILRSGLGYDFSNVGIITNISNDHLGMDGVETLEDMAYVKSVVAEAVHRKGSTVLNADDKHVVALSDRVRSSVIYFSAASDSLIVRRHLGAGGTAVFVKNGSIVAAWGTKIQKVLPVRHIPCTLGGQAQHNLQNALAAVAACIALETGMEYIREGLLSFLPNEKVNPGRLNMLELNNIRVVVDYGHNEKGYLNTLQTLKKLKPKRIIGVVAMPGDRKDGDIEGVGRIAAKYCDLIVIKEDSDTRGREPGEVAGILKHAVTEAGFSEDKTVICLAETAAVQKALELASKGDVVVVFYEKFEPVMKLIKSMQHGGSRRTIKEKDDRQVVC